MMRVAIVLSLLVLARPAGAHALDLAYLQITTAGEEISVRLDLDVNAIGPDLQTLAARTFEREPITGAAGPCHFGRAVATRMGATISVSAIASCADRGVKHWKLPMVADARFQLMVKQTVAGSERLTIIDKRHPEIEIALSPDDASLGRFVRSGIAHIGVAPEEWKTDRGAFQLPAGIDHILFLVALLLAGGCLLHLVGVASGFTLGHSITLALAALDIARPPAAIIEPLIALSIALAAAEAFTGRLAKQRWKIATGFGLVHGFGFATALSHLQLTTRGKLVALFGFNLGVELGQLVIVLAVAPLVFLLHRHERIGKPVMRVVAGVIFLCGVYWLFQRTLG